MIAQQAQTGEARRSFTIKEGEVFGSDRSSPPDRKGKGDNHFVRKDLASLSRR